MSMSTQLPKGAQSSLWYERTNVRIRLRATAASVLVQQEHDGPLLGNVQ